jgi:simple sugar transport system permease protein
MFSTRTANKLRNRLCKNIHWCEIASNALTFHDQNISLTMKLTPPADPQLTFLLLVNLVVVVLASAWSRGQFVGIDNLQSMASQVPELGLLAVGVMLTMVSGSGGIDLSGVALANLSGVAAALLAPLLFSPDASPVAYTACFVALCLSIGLMGGLSNGLLIAKARVTPILATLGTQLLFTGIAVVLTNGSTVRMGYVEPLAAVGNETIGGVPYAFLMFLLIVIALAWILKHTTYGVRLYLMGSNPKAARYAGIPLTRMLVTTYGISGLLAALSGVIIASRAASVKWDYGSSYLLITILITVMAGVRPAGGYGRITCLFFSAIALQVLSSSFNLMGISNFFRDCAWGALLLLFLASSNFDFKRWRG